MKRQRDDASASDSAVVGAGAGGGSATGASEAKTGGDVKQFSPTVVVPGQDLTDVIMAVTRTARIGMHAR